MAIRYGWRCHAERHGRPAPDAKAQPTPIKGHRGWPDFTAVHPHRGIIFAELKAAKGRFGPGQQDWIDDLARFDLPGSLVLVEVWRPADWDYIEVALRDGFDVYRDQYRNKPVS